MAKQKNAHSMIDSLIGVNQLKDAIKTKSGIANTPHGRRVLQREILKIKGLSDNPEFENWYNLPDYQKVHGRRDSLTADAMEKSADGRWAVDEDYTFFSPGIGDYQTYNINEEGRPTPPETEKIDWFNQGRWGESLKKTILDALTMGR